MMCEYCEYDENFGLKPFRDGPDCSAWLEECRGEWGIVTSITTRCLGDDCTSYAYVRVTHCPMCGREL